MTRMAGSPDPGDSAGFNKDPHLNTVVQSSSTPSDRNNNLPLCTSVSITPLIPQTLEREIFQHLNQHSVLQHLIQAVGMPSHNGNIVTAREVLNHMQLGTLTDDHMKQWEKFLDYFRSPQVVLPWVNHLERILGLMYSVADPQLQKYSTMFEDGLGVGAALGLPLVRCRQIRQDNMLNCASFNLILLAEARQKYFTVHGFSLQTLEAYHQLLKDKFIANNHRDISELCCPYNFNHRLEVPASNPAAQVEYPTSLPDTQSQLHTRIQEIEESSSSCVSSNTVEYPTSLLNTEPQHMRIQEVEEPGSSSESSNTAQVEYPTSLPATEPQPMRLQEIEEYSSSSVSSNGAQVEYPTTTSLTAIDHQQMRIQEIKEPGSSSVSSNTARVEYSSDFEPDEMRAEIIQMSSCDADSQAECAGRSQDRFKKEHISNQEFVGRNEKYISHCQMTKRHVQDSTQEVQCKHVKLDST